MMSGDNEALVRPLEPEDEALIALFSEMEKQNLATLDGAARQLVGLLTGLFGLFFGVLALGNRPAYLDFAEVQALAVITLGAFFVALLFALATLRPRRYQYSRHNLTEMRRLLTQMQATKATNLTRAHFAFGLGILFLTLLVLDLLLFR